MMVSKKMLRDRRYIVQEEIAQTGRGLAFAKYHPLLVEKDKWGEIFVLGQGNIRCGCFRQKTIKMEIPYHFSEWNKGKIVMYIPDDYWIELSGNFWEYIKVLEKEGYGSFVAGYRDDTNPVSLIELTNQKHIKLPRDLALGECGGNVYFNVEGKKLIIYVKKGEKFELKLREANYCFNMVYSENGREINSDQLCTVHWCCSKIFVAPNRTIRSLAENQRFISGRQKWYY